MDQQLYTSTEKRLDGLAGFGVKAQSEGITLDELAAINMHNHYHKPTSLADDAIEEAPVSLSFYRMNSGRFGLSHSRYIGRDFSQRWGNFFVHTVVCSAEDLEPFGNAPIVLYGESFWVSDDLSDSGVLPTLDALPTKPDLALQEISSFFNESPQRSRMLGVLLQALIERKSTARQSLLIDAPINVLKWIYALYASLPPNCRTALTFSTYESDPKSVEVDLIGMYPGEGIAHISGAHRLQYCIFDCASESLPDDIKTGRAALTISSLVANGNEERLQQIFGLAEALNIVQLDQFDDLVALAQMQERGIEGLDYKSVSSAIDLLEAKAQGVPKVAGSIVLDMVSELSKFTDFETLLVFLNGTRRIAEMVQAIEEVDMRLIMVALNAFSTKVDVGWLAAIDQQADFEDLRRKLSENIPMHVWREYVESSPSEVSSIWWLLSEAVSNSTEQMDEDFWRQLAVIIKEKGDKELVSRLEETINILAETSIDSARVALDAAGNMLIAVWPKQMLALALDFAMGSIKNRKPGWQNDVIRCVDYTEHIEDSDKAAEVVTKSIAQYPKALLWYLKEINGQDELKSKVIHVLHNIRGDSGATIRRAMLNEEYLRTMIDSLMEIDSRTLPPIEAVRLWIDPTCSSLNALQQDMMRKTLVILEDDTPNGQELKEVLSAAPVIQNYDDLLEQFTYLYICSGPIKAIPNKYYSAICNKLRESCDGAVKPKVLLRHNLTLQEQHKNMSGWKEFIAYAIVSERLAVSADDYAEYLDATLINAHKKKIKPPVQLDDHECIAKMIISQHLYVFLLAYAKYLKKSSSKAEKASAQAGYLLIIDLAQGFYGSDLQSAKYFVKALPSSVRKLIKDKVEIDINKPRYRRVQPDACEFLEELFKTGSVSRIGKKIFSREEKSK